MNSGCVVIYCHLFPLRTDTDFTQCTSNSESNSSTGTRTASRTVNNPGTGLSASSQRQNWPCHCWPASHWLHKQVVPDLYLNNNVGLFENERPGAGTARIVPLLLALPENGTRFFKARDYSIIIQVHGAFIFHVDVNRTLLCESQVKTLTCTVILFIHVAVWKISKYRKHQLDILSFHINTDQNNTVIKTLHTPTNTSTEEDKFNKTRIP
jgi:hypothetical protein